MQQYRYTRRGFAASLVSAGVASTCAGDDPAVGKSATNNPPTPGNNDRTADAPLPERPAEPPDLLLAALVQLYPSEHLTPQRLAGIRSGLRRNFAQAAVLRDVPLSNGDEPATMFRAWRGGN